MTAAMDRGATMKTYVDLARQGAQEYRDEVLYTFLLDGESQETHLTWTQLDVRARAVAAQLQEHGLAGRCVLLIYPAGLDYVVAFFACLYAGVIAVPAYPPMLNRSVSQLRNIIPDASIEVALTNGEVHAKLAALTGIEPALAQLSWLVTDAVPDDRAEDWRPPPITEDSIAFLQYTSGSTSAPKGAMLTHGNLTHCGAVFAERIIEPRTRLLSWLPQIPRPRPVLRPAPTGVRTEFCHPHVAHGFSASTGPMGAGDIAVSGARDGGPQFRLRPLRSQDHQ
jgi:acyl-CoA synthetase (AMP-forming)/AMP-acid ligase II